MDDVPVTDLGAQLLAQLGENGLVAGVRLGIGLRVGVQNWLGLAQVDGQAIVRLVGVEVETAQVDLEVVAGRGRVGRTEIDLELGVVARGRGIRHSYFSRIDFDQPKIFSRLQPNSRSRALT